MLKRVLSIGLLAAGLSFVNTEVFAQASETSVVYNKENANGFVANVSGDKVILTKNIEEYFKSVFKTKPSNSKGYKVFKGVVWPEVSQDKLDVYFKVDGKKGNNQVSMLVSKGYDNYITTASDPAIAAGVLRYLNGLQVATNNAAAVQAAEKAVEEAQKAQERAEKQLRDLKAEKEKIEKKISEQQKDVTEREKAVREAKDALENAKAKLK